MPRIKEKKTGFHLKYIPAGRLNDVTAMADSFPSISNKTSVACKYIETFSSVVERCWNSEKSSVGISESYLASKILGINPSQAKIILDDLVKHKFLKRDKSTYRLGKTAWSYKPLYYQLDAIAINRKFLNKKTDLMLDCSNISTSNPELKPYGEVISKIKLDATVYERMNYILHNKFYGGMLMNRISNYDTVYPHLYGGTFLNRISGQIYDRSLLPRISYYTCNIYRGIIVPIIWGH